VWHSKRAIDRVVGLGVPTDITRYETDAAAERSAARRPSCAPPTRRA
jgi:hypothetical protein